MSKLVIYKSSFVALQPVFFGRATIQGPLTVTDSFVMSVKTIDFVKASYNLRDSFNFMYLNKNRKKICVKLKNRVSKNKMETPENIFDR